LWTQALVSFQQYGWIESFVLGVTEPTLAGLLPPASNTLSSMCVSAAAVITANSDDEEDSDYMPAGTTARADSPEVVLILDQSPGELVWQ
jgi:hypothetical protein